MPKPDLAALNAVAASIGPFRFEREGGDDGRLALAIKHHDPRRFRVRADGLWFLSRVMGNRLGGTDEQALVQLARWARDQPRRGRPFWGRAFDPRTLALLEASGYFDPARTGCLVCGAADAPDWTDGDFLDLRRVGPLCHHGDCATAGVREPGEVARAQG